MSQLITSGDYNILCLKTEMVILMEISIKGTKSNDLILASDTGNTIKAGFKMVVHCFRFQELLEMENGIVENV